MRAHELKGAQIIGSHLFLTDKYGSNGEFVKTKARLVALGNRQDRSMYGDVSSPTITHEAIMLILSIAASRKWNIATIDVTGAYLEAEMPPNGPVFIELNRKMTKILCQLDPIYNEYVANNRSLVVKLREALYGCIQSGLV